MRNALTTTSKITKLKPPTKRPSAKKLSVQKKSVQKPASKAIKEFNKKYPRRETPKPIKGPDCDSDIQWGHFVDFINDSDIAWGHFVDFINDSENK